MKKYVIVFMLMVLSFNSVGQAVYPFNHSREQAQFEGLLHDLRCLVCQNQDLSGSNAPLAQDLKNDIYHMITSEHLSDMQIKDILVEQYGDFILFNPPSKKLTWLLWYGPFILVLLGLGALWCLVFKRR